MALSRSPASARRLSASAYCWRTSTASLTSGGSASYSATISFQALTLYGYVAIGDDNCYYPQLSAIAIVNFIDNLFPGMPGMNLVAYVIQLTDEVITGRKKLDVAVHYFEQTLSSRGVSLSDQTIKEEEKAQLKESATLKEDSAARRGMDLEARKAAVQTMARLKSMRGLSKFLDSSTTIITIPINPEPNNAGRTDNNTSITF